MPKNQPCLHGADRLGTFASVAMLLAVLGLMAWALVGTSGCAAGNKGLEVSPETETSLVATATGNASGNTVSLPVSASGTMAGTVGGTNLTHHVEGQGNVSTVVEAPAGHEPLVLWGVLIAVSYAVGKLLWEVGKLSGRGVKRMVRPTLAKR